MFSIKISLDKNVVYAEILNYSEVYENESFEYAFYLVENNKRINERWYRKENNASFNIELNDSNYYIKGFARSLDKSKKFIIDSEIINRNARNLDLEFFPDDNTKNYLYSILKDFDPKNGVHSIDIFGQKIDILFEGLDQINKDLGVLVCFSGAISNRSNKTPPFFSGKKISRKMGMPLISISDPSLAINSESNLTWYAGNENWIKLSADIAIILDIISERLDTNLIFFGGSAGGFAILSIINQVNFKAKGVVWNSQTSISEYKKGPVRKYLQSCFPNTKVTGSLYEALEKSGVVHDLLDLYSNKSLKNDSVLYMQNLGDIFQLERHALPFINSLNAKQKGDGVYLTRKGITFCLNDWGYGHIPPNENLIIKILTDLVAGSTPQYIALNL